MANIIDDIAALLVRIGNRAAAVQVELVDALDAGNGIDCIVETAYVLIRGGEVLYQGNNTDQEEEVIADRVLQEFTDDLPGNPVASSPSFILQVS